MTTNDSVRTAAPLSHGLRRVLGVGFGLAVIIGSTLGIGILRTPGLVAGQLHDASAILAVWVIGGIYTLLGSICLTELGAALPHAGGYYVYARRAFGDLVGFGVGWTDWLTYCSVLGYVSIAMAEFLGVVVPALGGWTRPVGVAALVLLVALQWAGVQAGRRFQEITTALKFAAFLALVVACFVLPVHSTSSSSLTAAAEALPAWSLTGLILALQAVVVTYGGWQSALYFTEEDRDVDRNLPRSMIGGVAVIVVIYVLVNAALLMVLPIPDLARSLLPAADAAQRLIGGRGGEIITVLSLISLVPLLNAILMIGTRILFGMGRDGVFWSRTADVNAGGTPAIATLVTTIVAVGLIATGTFQRLIAMTSFLLAANYCGSCLALIVLRRREPNLPRPFRAWGYPLSAWIVLAGALIFLGGALVGDPGNSLAAIALLALGLIGRAAVTRT